MIAVKMCGLPNIFEPPKNMTLEVGETAKFYCTVDMTCMVSYVEWYKQSDNGQCNWNLELGNSWLVEFQKLLYCWGKARTLATPTVTRSRVWTPRTRASTPAWPATSWARPSTPPTWRSTQQTTQAWLLTNSEFTANCQLVLEFISSLRLLLEGVNGA